MPFTTNLVQFHVKKAPAYLIADLFAREGPEETVPVLLTAADSAPTPELVGHVGDEERVHLVPHTGVRLLQDPLSEQPGEGHGAQGPICVEDENKTFCKTKSKKKLSANL